MPLLVMAGSLASLFPAGMWKAEMVSSHVYLVTPITEGAAWFLHYWIIKCERRGEGRNLVTKYQFKPLGFGDSFGCVWVCAYKFFLIGGELLYEQTCVGLDSSEYSQLLQMP